jgi:hypothetical protein
MSALKFSGMRGRIPAVLQAHQVNAGSIATILRTSAVARWGTRIRQDRYFSISDQGLKNGANNVPSNLAKVCQPAIGQASSIAETNITIADMKSGVIRTDKEPKCRNSRDRRRDAIDPANLVLLKSESRILAAWDR